MACSKENTRKQLRDKKIIDNFDVLIDKTSIGINRFINYSNGLKNYAIEKFGEVPMEPFQPLTSNKVLFNNYFFNWVDEKNLDREIVARSAPKFKPSNITSPEMERIYREVPQFERGMESAELEYLNNSENKKCK